MARTKTHSLPNFLIRAGKELGYPVVDANGQSMLGEQRRVSCFLKI